MTTIRFPHPSDHPELTPAEQARMLVVVVSGLRMLGEPSTLEELTLYAQHRFPRTRQPRLKGDVEAILHAYAEPGPSPLEDCTPFRRVDLDGLEAWAFNAEFRSALADSGLEVRLRNLVD